MAAISHQKGTSFKFISKWNLFWHHVNRPLQQMPDSDCIFFELSELTVWSSRWKLRIPNHVKFSTATGVPFTPNITNTWYVIHHRDTPRSPLILIITWHNLSYPENARSGNAGSGYETEIEHGGICACVFLERLFFVPLLLFDDYFVELNWIFKI